MEHEFVPGKRRCRNCNVKWGYRNDFACAAGRSEIPFDVPPPEPEEEPEKPPQVWHLNVWTSVNGVIFTASAEANDEVTNGQALQEKMVGSVLWAVKEITAEYTPTEETE